MRTPLRRAARRGYTLVEMVTVITILSIVGSVVSYVIVESMKVYARTAPQLDAAYQARAAVDRIRRDLRDLKDRTTLTTMTSTALAFDDNDDASISYALASGDLTRNGDLLAQGVTSLTFTFWQADGTSASVADEVHLVEIDLTVETASQPYRVQGAVFPRVVAHDWL